MSFRSFAIELTLSRFESYHENFRPLGADTAVTLGLVGVSHIHWANFGTQDYHDTDVAVGIYIGIYWSKYKIVTNCWLAFRNLLFVDQCNLNGPAFGT